MGKRLTDRERLYFKLDLLSDGEVHELLEYVSIMETMRRENVETGGLDDELLNLLAAAHENRRARQVFEWENTRRQADYSPTSGAQVHR